MPSQEVIFIIRILDQYAPYYRSSIQVELFFRFQTPYVQAL